jgi:integrase
MSKDKVTAGEQFKAATALRNALGEAVKIGLIAQNHATRVKRPKVKRKEAQAYTHEEARRIIDSAEGWFEVFVRLGFDSGMRPQELFALHWSEVDLAAGSVRVKWALDPVTRELKEPKTPKSRRTVLIGQRTVEALRSLKESATGTLVFPNARGGLLNISNVSYKKWKPLLKKAKVPSLGLYSLRHTSATLLLAENVNIKVVSERLGHESITITLHFYAHAMPSMQSLAAEVANRLFF